MKLYSNVQLSSLLLLVGACVSACSSSNVVMTPYAVSPTESEELEGGEYGASTDNAVIESIRPFSKRNLVAVSITQPDDTRKPSAIGQLGGSTWFGKWGGEEPIRVAVTSESAPAWHYLDVPGGVSIEGVLKEWYVNIAPAFPYDRAYAKAVLRLNVYDMLGQVRQSTDFTSYVTDQQWKFRESERIELLKDALDGLIDSIGADGYLLEGIGVAERSVYQ